MGIAAAFALGLGLFSVNCALAGVDSYRIAPGDAVTFDFLDDTELPVTLIVTTDGQGQFPLIGGVEVGGLTVSEALDKLRTEFKKREILVDPKISLNIATFRPIFVLGDVKSPGSFPFYPGLTVEQSIGLAGGTQTAVINPSDKLMVRARLRGEIDGTDALIVSEAVYAARLQSQLRGLDHLDLALVPKAAENYVKNTNLKSLIDLEEKILKSDMATMKSQTDILNEGITESTESLRILTELEAQQKEVVAMSLKDLDRVAGLRARELNTEADLSRAKTQASGEKASLLGIYAEMSRSRRELGNLKFQLTQLSADREKELLMKLQEREVTLQKLISSRQSAEEQFFLLASIESEEKDRAKSKISFSYEVRREESGKRKSITASTFTELLPGDVVVVSLSGT
ncbi:sugar ABC transporter substrate-binding protein [Sinorhizobium sp. BG8]|nr:sugar ABC transporter substrate-binding protein [Sinorhizobium sp. BG8]